MRRNRLNPPLATRTVNASVVSFLRIVAVLAIGIVPAVAAADNPVDFARDIHPILADRCVRCHGSETHEAGLRLDLRDTALAGSDSGKVILPGAGGDSLLISLVRGEDPDRLMPPEGETLTSDQIDLLRRWIDQGAKWPDNVAGEAPKPVHWAYQPLHVAPPPGDSPTTHPIDACVHARLKSLNIEPSPEADRFTLIKRLSYDLLGLPPDLETVDRFIRDTSDDAYERLVDELLASPHFGERWGRHWLDQARYADSDGYEKDNPRYHAWKYRDWVIQAINDDLPFDRFTIEQLAGDLLPNPTRDQLIATGFNRQTLTNTEGGVDQEEFRCEAIFDRVDTLGAVWLGLTVGCARCHSHKYDQVSQREYYQLFAFFNNADETTLDVPSSPEAVAKYQPLKEEWDQRVAGVESRLDARFDEITPGFGAWRNQMLEQLVKQDSQRSETGASVEADEKTARAGKSTIPDEIAKLLRLPSAERTQEQTNTLVDYYLKSDPQAAKLMDELKVCAKEEPFRPEMAVAVMTERTQDRRPTRLFRRGNFLEPLDEVETGALASLHKLDMPSDRPCNRLDLARWLVSPDNPLTPRVAVNQVWLHLFGEGLVKTVNDFGVRGDPPSPPELLDWLAAEFQRLGWSRKALIKTIVMSETYRQSPAHRPELADVDPENRLLHRQNRFRVEAEIIRDLYLASSGLLDRRIGGPSVFPPLPPGIAELSYANKFKWGESDWNTRPDRPWGIAPKDDVHRRGMYTFFKRTAAHPNLTTFDCPDSNTTCVSRRTSNTPLQALQTLNNDSFVEGTRAMSRRLLAKKDADDVDRLTELFRLCVARPPASDELRALEAVLTDARAFYRDDPAAAAGLSGVKSDANPAEAAAWTALSRVVMNLDEFLTRE